MSDLNQPLSARTGEQTARDLEIARVERRDAALRVVAQFDYQPAGDLEETLAMLGLDDKRLLPKPDLALIGARR